MKQTKHEYTCPHCGKPINPHSMIGAKWGAKGGKATGPSKSRGSEKARAAVMARWAKAKGNPAP